VGSGGTVCDTTEVGRRSYGRYNGPPPRAELERAFFLDDADKSWSVDVGETTTGSVSPCS